MLSLLDKINFNKIIKYITWVVLYHNYFKIVDWAQRSK